MSVWLVLIAIATLAVSGVPALFLRRTSDRAQVGSVVVQLVAASTGSIGAMLALTGDGTASLRVPAWPLLPSSVLGVDALSAVFLLPVFLLSGCAAVFGLRYWRQSHHPGTGRKVVLFTGLLTAGVGLLLIGRDAITFLVGWETMALAAFFLVCTEDDKPGVRAAGWVYLVATHVGTLALFGFFALLGASTGSLALVPIAGETLAPGRADAMFVLALVGFGIKAGIVPLHFWLPAAHANAPSHVSAVMSGVLIKMGVYGVVRVCALLPDPPAWWGQLLLAIGAVSTFVGVAFAIAQHDLKRLLAYHSIENIGIIFLGLGLAMTGRTAGRPEWIVLGLGGALLHVWNHGLFKGLLFLAAGATIHRVGTRDIDRLGGVGKAMPLTAGCFLIGAVAICGLPPLNGFVSELLVYLGLFHSLGGAGGGLASVAIAVLAMAGALALLCFVKVFGAVYLGVPRTDAVGGARESDGLMLAPMGVLAACCAAIGLLPPLVAPVLDGAIAAWSPAPVPALASLAPLHWVSGGGIALVLLTLAALRPLLRRRAAGRCTVGGTWDCGYGETRATMQYTASSFAQQMVEQLWWVLLPRVHRPRHGGVFPSPSAFRSHVPDAILDRVLLPAARAVAVWCSWLRRPQGASVNLCLLYVFLALLVLLLLR